MIISHIIITQPKIVHLIYPLRYDRCPYEFYAAWLVSNLSILHYLRVLIPSSQTKLHYTKYTKSPWKYLDHSNYNGPMNKYCKPSIRRCPHDHIISYFTGIYRKTPAAHWSYQTIQTTSASSFLFIYEKKNIL